ncbi:MFS transporter [Chloroflexota bacterium]
MFAHFSHHILTALVIPLLPFIRDEFSLDYAQSGLVLSVFAISYGIGQLPAGWLADRIGPRILVTVGISGVALSGLLVGFSQTYIMMLVFLALMGLTGGGYHPSAVPLISASVEPKNRGRALGLHQIGSSASHFLVPLIAAAIATAWGWRGSFIALAIPAIVFGMVFYVLLDRRVHPIKAEYRIAHKVNDAPSSPKRLSHLVPFMVLVTFTAAVLFSTAPFIPLFLVDHFNISEGQAAASLALFYSAGLWMSPLGGYLSDRFGRLPVILGVCLFTGPVIYLLNLAPDVLSISVIMVAIGMLTFTLLPVSEAYIMGQIPENRRSTVLGIYYFFAMEAGSILTPGLGYLIDQSGFYSSFLVIGAAILTVTFVCAGFLWRRRG